VRTSLRLAVQSCIILIAFPAFDSSSAFGQGSNPFFTPPIFSGSGQALSADVNGDGKADLLFFDGTVLLGKGDGTFTTGTPWRSTSGSPNIIGSQFAIADFNGDGRADIFVIGPLNVLSVLLGNGDGTFQPATTTSVANLPSAFLVGDLNGDGRPDVLAQVGPSLSRISATVTVLSLPESLPSPRPSILQTH
jgi:FG-GAP-like repeat